MGKSHVGGCQEGVHLTDSGIVEYKKAVIEMVSVGMAGAGSLKMEEIFPTSWLEETFFVSLGIWSDMFWQNKNNEDCMSSCLDLASWTAMWRFKDCDGTDPVKDFFSSTIKTRCWFP